MTLSSVTDKDWRVRIIRSIAEIAADDWDACAGTSNPFTRHAFLLALEESGSVGGASGWLPQHLALEDGSGQVLGAAPMYLKGHSYGEYVFDQNWANAYAHAGGRYYPKLQIAVPFTPVTGPRFLAAPGTDGDAVRRALLRSAIDYGDAHDLSSLHITFLTEAEWRLAGDMGLLQRIDSQFHWQNADYPSFDAFLESLSSRKRKAIRRERREALAPGITVETLSGADLREAHWDAFFAFYMNTGERKWGRPYLNREFFSLLGERMGESVVLMLANRGGRTIAGALNLKGADALYGRYWGAVEDHPFLHFELCYYQAIDYAIAHKLARVEAGAQGDHKLARGYLPYPTYSVHWIRDPHFREAVARYLENERQAVKADIDALTDYGPFRKE